MGKRRRKLVHAKDRGPSAPTLSLVWNSSNCRQFLLGDSECLIEDVTFLLLFVLLLGNVTQGDTLLCPGLWNYNWLPHKAFPGPSSGCLCVPDFMTLPSICSLNWAIPVTSMGCFEHLICLLFLSASWESFIYLFLLLLTI